MAVTVSAALVLMLIFAVFFFVVVLYMDGKRETAGVKWYQFWLRGDTQFPRMFLYWKAHLKWIDFLFMFFY